MWFIVPISCLSILYGIWLIIHPRTIAQRNAEFIASGEEGYFEQRRAWKAYGTTPPTDAAEVSRRGRKEIILGVLGLILATALYLFDKGA